MTTNTKKLDWNSATTKKHIKEAKAVGLTLIGEGKDKNTRLYLFNDCQHKKVIDPRMVRANKFRCSECIKEEHAKAGKKIGFTLIDKSPTAKNKKRKYRCDKCGYEEQHNVDAILGGLVRCSKCLEDKHIKEANEKGLTYLGKDTGSKRRYRFNDCEHKQKISTSKVRSGEFTCQKCFENELHEDAKRNNFTLVGHASGNRRKYKCNECGHEEEKESWNVKQGQITCTNCQKEKLIQEATEAGVVIIGKGRNSDRRLYKINRCGHKQDISVGAVRNKTFNCQTCEESYMDLPSHVYLLQITDKSFTWLKLGYAKEIMNRVGEYGLSSEAEVEILISVNFEKGREAWNYETGVHRKYSTSRLPPSEMKKFHINGFRECYPMKMLDTLMDELESKSTQ